MVSEFIELRAPKMSYRYFDQIEMQPRKRSQENEKTGI
ncbi:hypothetical protein C789_1159 [Microcystis aeruginosa FACHB-905 = DIANCHI905]|uniref:Uncharacterized protein n=1 Tax=Microcystis aeruginosa PCC 7806SL TaxID=1903187 RepID=A0AB33C6K1_MICA7|nr:hypothetical protein BH695_3574 [Microcystis aeruginosa PCC 7806SL]ELS49035.1 hypothetical protein C789_1159 [Microcystis aeruginosa FACHB-905 = DIANCHI905]